MKPDPRHVIGCDPGPTDYSWARYDGTEIVEWGTCAIGDLPNTPLHGIKGVGVEKVVPYGRAVGRETMQTCENAGRIGEILRFATGAQVVCLSRTEIASALKCRKSDVSINCVVGRLCPLFARKRAGLNGHHRAAAAVAIVTYGRIK